MDFLQNEIEEKSLQGLLMEVNRRCLTLVFHQLMELGVYPGQIPVLGRIVQKEGSSQKEIADFLHIKPPTVNVSITRLEKAGLVCRRQDEKDQRVSRIYMTDKGKDIIEQAMEKVRRNEQSLFENFNEAELCLMRRFLLQILDNIDGISDPMEKDHKKKEGVNACWD